MKDVKGLFLVVVLCLTATVVWAGEMDSPGAPGSNVSKMYTLEDIYQRLNDNTQASSPETGSFTEPGSGPNPGTGRTLDDVYEKAIPTQVPKTGQTTSSRTHDDGDLKKGVSWPSPRFTDNDDGTVTDKLTGLIWLKNANCAGGQVNWDTAVDYCAALYDGCTTCFGTAEDCGLRDGSVAGDWRLPNLKELQSLIDFGQSGPALPSEYPFTGVLSAYYWSGTTLSINTGRAWHVALGNGHVGNDPKTFACSVWPVRAGQ
jgi:hypothetical protein